MKAGFAKKFFEGGTLLSGRSGGAEVEGRMLDRGREGGLSRARSRVYVVYVSAFSVLGCTFLNDAV